MHKNRWLSLHEIMVADSPYAPMDPGLEHMIHGHTTRNNPAITPTDVAGLSALIVSRMAYRPVWPIGPYGLSALNCTSRADHTACGANSGYYPCRRCRVTGGGGRSCRRWIHTRSRVSERRHRQPTIPDPGARAIPVFDGRGYSDSRCKAGGQRARNRPVLPRVQACLEAARRTGRAM